MAWDSESNSDTELLPSAVAGEGIHSTAVTEDRQALAVGKSGTIDL
jgi:hypothetical protein